MWVIHIAVLILSRTDIFLNNSDGACHPPDIRQEVAPPEMTLTILPACHKMEPDNKRSDI